jgi:hypothetical protein
MNLPEELQQAVSTSRAKLSVGYPWWLRPFLQRGVVAITLGRRIYILPEFLQRAPGDVDRLVRHELAHVRQVARYTLPLFLILYAWEFVKHFARERSVHAAYRKIRFEVEAEAAETAGSAIIRRP